FDGCDHHRCGSSRVCTEMRSIMRKLRNDLVRESHEARSVHARQLEHDDLAVPFVDLAPHSRRHVSGRAEQPFPRLLLARPVLALRELDGTLLDSRVIVQEQHPATAPPNLGWIAPDLAAVRLDLRSRIR